MEEACQAASLLARVQGPDLRVGGQSSCTDGASTRCRPLQGLLSAITRLRRRALGLGPSILCWSGFDWRSGGMVRLCLRSFGCWLVELVRGAIKLSLQSTPVVGLPSCVPRSSEQARSSVTRGKLSGFASVFYRGHACRLTLLRWIIVVPGSLCCPCRPTIILSSSTDSASAVACRSTLAGVCDDLLPALLASPQSVVFVIVQRHAVHNRPESPLRDKCA